MPEDQFAYANWGNAPILLNDLPSGLHRYSYSPSPPSSRQLVKQEFEVLNATDDPLEPYIPPFRPNQTVKYEYEAQDTTGEALRPSTSANEAEDATNEDLASYIPAGILRKSSSTTHYPASEVALLEQYQWIRIRTLENSDNVQIYVLPDVERGSVPRSASRLRSALKLVMSKIDSAPDAWNGLEHSNVIVPNDEEDESLWYIFNTLQDPDPSPHGVNEMQSQEAMEDLLEDSVLGLKTSLHRYQRRSAAVMVQREAQPALVLDPRLQAWHSPTGAEFYYDKETGSIMREKIMYPEACGGILAESMGYGKTLISLAVILATRGHFPKIPVEHQAMKNPIRKTTGTLLQMAAATAGRFSQPWKHFFRKLESEGRFYNNCIKACETYSGSYNIPPQGKHKGRASSSYIRSAEQICLCSGTIVVVPPNLVSHWEREIDVHTSGLKVLVLREKSDKTPSTDALLNFDIVLFSKNRFVQEIQSRAKDVTNSPIFNLHWLRVIVDEGHDVAGQGSDLVHLLQQLHFERRWIISGTPARRMYGVELSHASQQANTSDTESSSALTAAILKRRKGTGSAIDDELRDLGGLGRMVTGFLDLKPWSNDRKQWTKYTRLVGEDGVRRKAPSLRATIQSLVVRHRLDVVHQEITLPPMSNKVVYLNPGFYDRLSINIFLFSLAVNAITSERQGPDYMFDPKNKKNLDSLIGNLRQAGFWWVGSGNDLQSTVSIALEYLEKNQDKMSVADLEQLSHGIQIAQKALGSSAWNEFNNLRELGVFVRGFPEHARSLWALDSLDADQEPLLMGIAQACRAQEFVTKHLRASDPAEGLAGYGIKVRRDLAKHNSQGSHSGAPESANPPAQPVKSTNSKKKKQPKQTFEKKIIRTLPDDSPLKQTLLSGVTSAKLRYLLEKVLEFQETEKIIIFFEDDNTAIWVAEGLELIAVNFRIYANSKSLKSDLRDQYLNLFRDSQDVRVLLMDLKQASHGLNIVQASRVFIINPIWEPYIESQAIKRAHRIGQTKPVHVETLVLRDTIEDWMLRRRKEMSEAEIQHAKSPLDDMTMSDIIRNARFLPMFDEASTAMAPLAHPIGLFDRHPLLIPDDEVVPARSALKRRQLPVSDSDADSDSAAALEGAQTKRPRLGFAETVQVLDDSSADAASVTLRHMPGRDLTSGSEIPTSENARLGFAERVVVWDDDRGPGLVPSMPVHAVPPSPSHFSPSPSSSSSSYSSSSSIKEELDDVQERVSLFGP